MKVGVTGLAGSLGGLSARLLRAAGHTVVDLDAWCWNPDPAALAALPTDLDWVLHFAARTSIAESLADPDGFLRDNLASTRAALDAAVHAHAALLYMSSYVYGQPRYNPVDEKHPVAELNPYMASKRAGGQLCAEVCAEHNLPLVVLRPFSIYGARRQPGRLVSDLLDCVRSGAPLAINDPTPRRDHLHAHDFGRLIVAIVATAISTTAAARAEVYNVGAGIAHANIEVAELVRELTEDPRPVQVAARPRSGDVSVCIADIRKVTAVFGWRPQIALRDGLRGLLLG